MTVNSLAKLLGDASYVFLTLNFFWGLFCTIVVSRKLRELQFRNERMQQAFVEELNEYVAVGDFDSAIAMCEADVRALPQLASLVLTNRDLRAHIASTARYRAFAASHRSSRKPR